MNINTVLDDIVTRLKAQIANTTKVESYPNDPEDYFKTHPGDAVLVAYDSSTYTEAEPNRQAKIQQTRTLRWVISIVHKSLKFTDQEDGIYATIESVRTALTGYKKTGEDELAKMRPDSDRFVVRDTGTGKWIFESVWLQDVWEAES